MKAKTNKYRVLWIFAHTTLRYEEIPMFIKAGFEIVPMTAKQIKLFNVKEEEESYDDKNHPLYPKWKNHCTIPDKILDKILKIDIFKGKYHSLNVIPLKKEEEDLINEWFDVIYIATFPQFATYFLTWFNGLTLVRYFGHPDCTYTEVIPNLKWNFNLNLFLNGKRKHIFCPILQSLAEREDKSIANEYIYQLPYKISKKRFGNISWKGGKSENFVCTALSYIYVEDETLYTVRFYKHLKGLFKKYNVPYKILGKNDKEIAKKLYNDDNIVGQILDDKKYFDYLSRCRVYIECGQTEYQSHYVSYECMTMGIPVVMLEKSGIPRELKAVAKENPLKLKSLEEYGIFETWDKVILASKRCLNDLNYAKKLVKNQREIVKKLISEERFLKHLNRFKNDIPKLMKENIVYSKVNANELLLLNAKLEDKVRELKKENKRLKYPFFVRPLRTLFRILRDKKRKIKRKRRLSK